MTYRAMVRSRALQMATNGIALSAMVTLLFAPHSNAGFVLAFIALAAVIWFAATVSFSMTMPAQLMITVGLLAADQNRIGDTATATLVATGALLTGLVVAQPNLQELVNRPSMRVANLPGYQQERHFAVQPRVFYGANLVLIGWLGVTELAAATLWPVLVATIAVCVGVSAIGVHTLRSRLRGRTDQRSFRAALLAYDPMFAVYFSAPANSEYQLAMWLPEFERIREPFVIIVREALAFRRLAAATEVPVVYCPAVDHVEASVTDHMRACFYVNNAAKNSHMVRFSHLTHVFIGHGDSDKASSANPVTAMFDRIFVAGRAGIDRFEANGVAIPADRFDIVGRPQAAPIAVTDRPIADVPDDTKTVLYATTWRGIYTDANYSSLPSGDRIVAALLARGVRVIFRPHPNVSKHPPSSRQAARVERMLADDAAKTGRQHVYGPAATEAMSVVDCVNASDALIADISGIATDWLYSAKPFALTNSMGLSPAEFETEFPIARAAYVLDGELATVDTVLDKLLGDDPLAVTRRAIRGYYLGDIPPEAYADTFVETARRYVRGTPSVGAPHGAFEVSDEDQPVLRSRRSAPRIA